MTLTSLRYAHGEWFRRVASKEEFDVEGWVITFDVGAFASGVVWGAAGIWLLPHSVEHQTFVAFVLGGMVAGATATYSVRMDAFLAYAVPALAPLAFRFFSMGDELHVAMGAMVVLFGLLMTATAHQVHRLTSRTHDLSSERDALRSALRTEREKTGSLEARLALTEEALAEKTQERIQSYYADRTTEVDSATTTDVGDFIRGFARSWEESRPANIDVWWNWSGHPLTVRVDPATLEIVLRQLLTNACEAIGDERGTIEVRARRARREDGAHPESYVTVEVIDDGASTSKTTLDQAFDLAIAKSLLRRHHGQILVESGPLRGTEARLLLPEAGPAVPGNEEQDS
jgi:signal transduction histidine kinase